MYTMTSASDSNEEFSQVNDSHSEGVNVNFLDGSVQYAEGDEFLLEESQSLEDRKSCTCKDCGKVFNSVWYLKQHAVKHSSERPFKCKYCHKTYRFRSNLYQHKCPSRDRAYEMNGSRRSSSSSHQQPQQKSSPMKRKATATNDAASSFVVVTSSRKNSPKKFAYHHHSSSANGGNGSNNNNASSTIDNIIFASAYNVNNNGAGGFSKLPTMSLSYDANSDDFGSSDAGPSPGGSPQKFSPSPSNEEIQQFLDRHKDQLHKCPQCKFLFPSREYLTRHMSYHDVEESKVKCTFCSELFDNDQQYGLHKQSHVPHSSHVCAKCKGKFCHALALKKHATKCRRFWPTTPTPSNNAYNPALFIDRTPPSTPVSDSSVPNVDDNVHDIVDTSCHSNDDDALQQDLQTIAIKQSPPCDGGDNGDNASSSLNGHCVDETFALSAACGKASQLNSNSLSFGAISSIPDDNNYFRYNNIPSSTAGTTTNTTSFSQLPPSAIPNNVYDNTYSHDRSHSFYQEFNDKQVVDNNRYVATHSSIESLPPYDYYRFGIDSGRLVQFSIENGRGGDDMPLNLTTTSVASSFYDNIPSAAESADNGNRVVVMATTTGGRSWTPDSATDSNDSWRGANNNVTYDLQYEGLISGAQLAMMAYASAAGNNVGYMMPKRAAPVGNAFPGNAEVYGPLRADTPSAVAVGQSNFALNSNTSACMSLPATTIDEDSLKTLATTTTANDEDDIIVEEADLSFETLSLSETEDVLNDARRNDFSNAKCNVEKHKSNGRFSSTRKIKGEYECATCNDTFKTTRGLRDHFLRKHIFLQKNVDKQVRRRSPSPLFTIATGETPYQDETACSDERVVADDSAVATSPGRTNPIKKDVKLPTFACNECTKCYCRKYDLTRHIRSCHSNDQESSLPTDELIDFGAFGDKSEVSPSKSRPVRNLVQQHSVPPPAPSSATKKVSKKVTERASSPSEQVQYPCAYCSKTFGQRTYARKHERQLHEIPAERNGEPSSLMFSFKNKDLHKHKCELCVKRFSSRRALLQHVAFHRRGDQV